MTKRLYTEDHEWIEINEDEVTIGITTHAVEELGEIIYLELPNIGDAISKGAEFGTIESVKTVSSLYAPVDGEVIDTNQMAVDSPDIINNSPFIDGWLIKVKLEDSSDLNELMEESNYEAYLNN